MSADGYTYVHVLRTGEARNPLGSVARLDMVIAVGFGSATVSRNGVLRTGEARNPLGSVARLDMVIAVGFGSATVSRNGVTVLDGERFYSNARKGLASGDGWTTVRHAEKLARRRRRPRDRWTIEINAPLWSATWERKRPGKWVCIEAGEGFA